MLLAFASCNNKQNHGDTTKSEKANAEGPQRAAGTLHMIDLLKGLANASYPEKNKYANRERVNYFRSLERTADPSQKLGLYFKLGLELLRAGETEEAINQLIALRNIIIRDQDKINISYKNIKSLNQLIAISYMRLGEQDNCILNHATESCIFPIEKSGIHKNQRGSLAAVKDLTALLNEDPEDPTLRWLLNIAYMTLGKYPTGVPEKWLINPGAFESEYDIKKFHDVAPGLGLDVRGLCGGSIMEDFDGDGYLDIVASSWGLTDQLRYFHNNGDGTFSDHTTQAGLIGIVGGLNLIHADYNNDGYTDIFILRGAWLNDIGKHPNSLLKNNGDGTFDDVTDEAGLLSYYPTQTAAWGDYNNDGWLDLFIGNESVNYGSEAIEFDIDVNQRIKNRCQLFRNNGNGTFTDIAKEVGVDVFGFVKGVAWGDYNNDGYVDLYISFLDKPNTLFRNNGIDGSDVQTFTDVSETAHVKEPYRSFPTWFWDYNNDGWLDIFVASYHSNTADITSEYLGFSPGRGFPRLYRNNGDGTFEDVTAQSNLTKIIYAMGCNFGDLDNDGFQDFYAGTGDPSFETLIPNRMFRNAGGKYFQDVTTSGGFGHLQKGHGISFGDIDNDGDQDIYTILGGAYEGDSFQNVLFNNPGHGNKWITLKLEGVRCNRSAIGSRVKISVTGQNGLKRDIHNVVSTGGSFGSSSLQLEIGLGNAKSLDEIQIVWAGSQNVQNFKKVVMNAAYKIVEGKETMELIKLKVFPLSTSGSNEHVSVHQHIN